MKEGGTQIKHTDWASFGTLMAMFTKGSGEMTKPTGMAFTFIQMEPGMKALGRTTNSTAKV
jgi:hypothetical protein